MDIWNQLLQGFITAGTPVNLLWAFVGCALGTAVAGPMPGNTPTAVPSAQPTKAHSKFTGVPAVIKPCKSWFQISILCTR